MAEGSRRCVALAPVEVPGPAPPGRAARRGTRTPGLAPEHAICEIAGRLGGPPGRRPEGGRPAQPQAPVRATDIARAYRQHTESHADAARRASCGGDPLE